MKVMELARLCAACGMIGLIFPPAFAQTLTTGTMVPITASSPAPTLHHHDRQHHKHEKHKKDHHKGRTKSPFLPASEQFSNLNAARAHCPSGQVEWASMGSSALYHNSSSRWFGRTKHGVYACKTTLDAAGFRPGK